MCRTNTPQIVRDTFNLSYIILDREDLQSVDRFGDAILDDNSEFGDASNGSGDEDESVSLPLQSIRRRRLVDRPQTLPMHSKLAGASFQRTSSNHLERPKLDSRRLVNVVIAKDFNFAHEDVQVQALEVRHLLQSTRCA